MRFTQEQIDSAIAEFSANAKSRVLAGAGHNKDIMIYTEVQNVTIQTAAGQNTDAGDTGPDGG